MGIVVVLGYPASGKTTLTNKYIDLRYARFNRDQLGGSISELHRRVDVFLSESKSLRRGVVLDNTYPTAASRAELIKIAHAKGRRAKVVHLQATIEDAQLNMCHRLWEHFGRIPNIEEIKEAKHPNLFPPSVLFRYRKEFELPTLAEGWDEIEKIPFLRIPYWQLSSVFLEGESDRKPTGKALILDYDGTLRRTKSGNKYPTDPEDIEILPHTREVLQGYQERGFRLLGASNQSGIHKGSLTTEQAEACFKKTNELIGMDIEWSFCPHQSAPLSCYCRKPMPGMAVNWIRKYNLDPEQVTMVGDFTSDKTFAKRAGIQYVDQAEFFKR